ncbi:MAG: PAS domain-containing protein [Alphaproteobacteria bacterium]|jgi:predicted DNA-binding ribbon-helix-helix protein|nr:PAS domain-containing protein [Alphaproteobacteria bacterium]
MEPTMIRKTMRVGEVRTSIKLEPEFWEYLREIADHRRMRLSALVNEVAAAAVDRNNLASTLRTYAILHARNSSSDLKGQVEMLTLIGSSDDLNRVFDACPLPALILDDSRGVREVNRAFALWLNLDRDATIGHKLDHLMILRGQSLPERWQALYDGRVSRVHFNATYISPGKVRTSQAVAVPLAAADPEKVNGTLVMFETLAGRE